MSTLFSSGLIRVNNAPSTTTAATIASPFVTGTIGLVQVGDNKGGRRFRNIGLTFSADADNATGNFAVWARLAFATNLAPQSGGGALISLGTGTFTAGNIVGSAGHAFGATEFLADTVTFTPSTFLTNLLTTLGAATPLVWSPADNTPALVRIEDVGNYDVYVDVWRNSAASVSAFAEVGV